MSPRSVTFIHAADLHIGAPFKGLRSSSETWANKMTHAVPDAFGRMIDLALDEKVDFVVLPGDIFDNSHPSYRDFRMFLRGMNRLRDAGIPVYYCTGNHDPLISWHGDFEGLPDNMHAFSSERASFFTFERDGEPLVLLGGRGFMNASFPADEDVSAGISKLEAERAQGCEAPFVVGVMHSGLDIDPTRAPVSPSSLMGRGVTYWALGHVHHFHALPDKGHAEIAYSGTPQGRAAKEVGPHGVLVVTLTEGRPNSVRFVDTASIEWQKVDVDVSSCRTISEMREAIVNAQFSLNAQSHAKEMIFRICLTGRTKLHERLTPEVLDQLRESLNDGFPFFYVDALDNRTSPDIDEGMLRAEGLFTSVYLDSFDGLVSDSSNLLSRLEEGYRSTGQGMLNMSQKKVERLSQDAKSVVLDLLV